MVDNCGSAAASSVHLLFDARAALGLEGRVSDAEMEGTVFFSSFG